MSAKYPYTDFHELNDDILIARVQNLKEHVKEQDVRIDDIIHNIPDVNDYYDKDEVDDLLDDKADKSNTYTKTEVNNLLDDKVDDTELNNYYTKTETDDLLDDKVDTTDLATVAFSGDYDDLSNKPTIPPAQVNSDWNATSGVAEILNKPVIPDVSNFYTKTETNTLLNGKENSLGSGEIGEVLTQVSSNIKSWVEPHYMPPGGTSGQVLTKASNDNYAAIWDDPAAIVQEQSNWTEADSTAVSYIKNKPTLATVATSGSYSDLTNKPTIPAAQVNSNWNATSGVAQILNKPSLATVATSGSYTDLSNKPTIPSVGNGTLTIQKNGTNVTTFTANQSGNATANITCENKISWTTSGNWHYFKDSSNVYHMHYREATANKTFNSQLGQLYWTGAVIDVSFPVSLTNVYSVTATVQCSNNLAGIVLHSFTGSKISFYLWCCQSGTRPVAINIDVTST